MSLLFNIISLTIVFAVPLMLVALGGMFSERSGVVNIALEGIMVIGALCSCFTLSALDKQTGNYYKSIVIMSKRADQIANDLKQEFQEQSQQYASNTETLEEVFENREQIELSKFYEQLPKPTQLALYEFEHDQIYFKDEEEL